MNEWILLTYKLHDDIERMIIPDYTRVSKPQYNWVFYVAYATYKLIQYYK